MQQRLKSTKLLKREKVSTFDGEENFIVPKKGGFGQPDNENFVNVVTQNTIETPTSPPIISVPSTLESGQTNSTNISVISAGQTGTAITPSQTTNVPPPTETTSPAPLPDIAPSTVTSGSGSTGTNPTGGNTGIISDTQTGTHNVAPVDANVISTIPQFPNWSSLSCADLHQQITLIEGVMATSQMTSAVADAYNSQLATARALELSKCSQTTPPAPTPTPTPAPTPVLPVIPAIPIGGGGFGGGGGARGVGEKPTSATTQTAVVKPKSYLIYLILGLAGLGYLYMTKKKAS